ncbi:MAG: malonyl-ACP O-methyltransferase BioC [Legionellaceae bacterium]|nr:malonyl-ACP O-methyltransferase BioC [Legionellaceae bacterium]MBP9775216.1 malonyl-ACP O-methyltransferase BioC [Legionellaceae bacterium]
MKSILEIGQSFNAHAGEYEAEAQVQLEIGQRLFERLDYLKMSPRTILDIGCGPGTFLTQLAKRYPKAEIVALDIAHSMLSIAKAKQTTTDSWHIINADMHQMPFANDQFDLIFSNQVLHWTHSLPAVLGEWQRILRPDGCLLFSTLGPDTFQELRQAFQQVDAHAHVNTFYDMHHVGDCLLKQAFADPVVDMEVISAHYDSLKSMLGNIKSQGVKNIHEKRKSGLMGKDAWRKFEEFMALTQTLTHKYPLTYEVVYGHAWKSAHQRVHHGGETTISIAELKASLPSQRV